MIRSHLFVFLITLLGSCAQTFPASRIEKSSIEPAIYHPQYDRSALQNLKWLTGAWKGKGSGREITQSFLFHTDQLLEVGYSESGNQKAAQYFSWKDGHYYYGQNRQWIVTWISEKNIRFDPLVPGLTPMTWSRVQENEWHLIQHTAKGDDITVMSRIDENPT